MPSLANSLQFEPPYINAVRGIIKWLTSNKVFDFMHSRCSESRASAVKPAASPREQDDDFRIHSSLRLRRVPKEWGAEVTLFHLTNILPDFFASYWFLLILKSSNKGKTGLLGMPRNLKKGSAMLDVVVNDKSCSDRSVQGFQKGKLL